MVGQCVIHLGWNGHMPDRIYFSKAIKNVNEYSKEAEIRILAHKMDLIEPEKREIIINKISNLFGVDEYENVKVYETSIFEDTLFKAIKSVL